MARPQCDIPLVCANNLKNSLVRRRNGFYFMLIAISHFFCLKLFPFPLKFNMVIFLTLLRQERLFSSFFQRLFPLLGGKGRKKEILKELSYSKSQLGEDIAQEEEVYHNGKR
jgi:hypothetical protein